MAILKNSFENLSDEDAEILQEYFHGYNYRGAGYTLLANYMWRNTHCIHWELTGGYLFISGGSCKHEIIAMPLTKTGTYNIAEFREAVLSVKKRFDEQNVAFEIDLVPAHMLHIVEEAFPEGIKAERDSDMDEYVYLKEKLITLSGRALHKKKNHMNYFLKTWQYEVRPVTREMSEEVIDLLHRVHEDREYDEENRRSLALEETAIKEILSVIGRADVHSCAIYIEGKLEAFALGEIMDGEIATEHFEKANDDYRGLYQVICSEFCKSLPEEIIYVNREEDMGIENLRKAKLALKPISMEERYTIDFCN